MTVQTTAVVRLSTDHVGTSTDKNATKQQQKNCVFCAVRAAML
jgi:hypothetical protein